MSFHNTALGHFFQTAFANIFVQLIAFLFYPFISRIYNPDEFGVYAFFTSITVIGSLVVTGQFHNAIVNPESDEEALHLLSIAFWTTAIGSLIVFAVTLIFLDGLWRIFPVFLLIYSMFEVLRIPLVRYRLITELNITQLSTRLLANILKVILPISSGSLWLLLSDIFTLGLASGGLVVWKKYIPHSFRKTDWGLVKKYYRFPVFQTSSLLLQFLISECPVFYFKSIGDLESLGYYAMGNKLFVQPFLLVGNALHPVLIHKFQKSKTFDNKVFVKMICALAGLSVISLILMHFLQYPLVNIFLGKKWVGGATIYQIQMFLILTKLFSGLILSYFIARDSSHILMSVRGIEAVFLIGVLLINPGPFLPYFVSAEVVTDFVLLGIVILQRRRAV